MYPRKIYTCAMFTTLCQSRHWMEVSDVHTKLGEAFGFVCWMWIFHRARNDLPVVLGWRHPWEHAEDPWAAVSEASHEDVEEWKADWDKFQEKAAIPGDGDDDEEEEDEEDDEEEDEEDEDDVSIAGNVHECIVLLRE